MEDIDAPFGLGRSIDRSTSDERVLVLKAHGFSAYAVSRALRMQNAACDTRQDVHDALLHLDLGDDEDDALRRVKTRAEQITKLEDLRVRDILWDESVGLVICRERDLFVMRPLGRARKTCSSPP